MFKTWEEMTRKEQLESIFWDFYKDVHGFRPRHIDISAMSEAELEKELNYLESESKAQEEFNRKCQQAAIAEFENLVDRTIMSGAKNRDEAMRWIHEAHGTQGDNEFLCYELGLPFSYFREAA